MSPALSTDSQHSVLTTENFETESLQDCYYKKTEIKTINYRKREQWLYDANTIGNI